jgi:hypothetical protein
LINLNVCDWDATLPDISDVFTFVLHWYSVGQCSVLDDQIKKRTDLCVSENTLIEILNFVCFFLPSFRWFDLAAMRINITTYYSNSGKCRKREIVMRAGGRVYNRIDVSFFSHFIRIISCFKIVFIASELTFSINCKRGTVDSEYSHFIE